MNARQIFILVVLLLIGWFVTPHYVQFSGWDMVHVRWFQYVLPLELFAYGYCYMRYHYTGITFMAACIVGPLFWGFVAGIFYWIAERNLEWTHGLELP